MNLTNYDFEILTLSIHRLLCEPQQSMYGSKSVSSDFGDRILAMSNNNGASVSVLL